MADKGDEGSAKTEGGAGGEEVVEEQKEEEGPPIYPLVVQCDVSPEWAEDIVDKVNNYYEKYGSNFEACAKMIKSYMDDKYAVEGKWHVVIGDSFALDVFCNKGSLIYMLVAGTTAVILWKCP
ncbi:dynein axonemal light chain 4-like [Paramacrobiotus metropolitanus]|uniref:dynein axonemal light chain 4-like n=1 Tax=Paramacrobiotus metropolitanus TaxID=2943436 RepID=UPI00244635C8|nr:dynein axonemal light chain 4-like [Paramacrobiotus metropolitanus]XP_055341544.1 dynein axonemal light chain 4-like [Paramacrobiotus metropolitanus]XP_055341545.1 dynein axonemal light chain 4-like [Paramacrobiotus metropolitanus]